MNFNTLLKILSDKSCNKVYVKRLSANDNSKNQVYLGGSFDILNILPFKEIVSVDPGDWKRNRFKTKLDFYWINSEGVLINATDAQLILYPKYPEVRFSGFLKGAKDAPSELMASRIEARLLFFGISTDGKIIGHVVAPDSQIANEFNSLKDLPEAGVFKEITIDAIQKMVCEYFDVPYERLLHKTRKREIVQARQITMYLAKAFTKNSLKTIGEHFGGRDHTTVIHSCQTVKDLMDTDTIFRENVMELTQKVQLAAM